MVAPILRLPIEGLLYPLVTTSVLTVRRHARAPRAASVQTPGQADPGGRRLRLLTKCHNVSSAVVLNQPEGLRVRHPGERQARRRPARTMEVHQLRHVDVRRGIPVHSHEGLVEAQDTHGIGQRAGGPKRGWLGQ